ncbi:hypothetical protein BJI67_08815 [Acidihalobacter aeolianus]|uniref:DUF2934 domain-containing protein n=1 Tax=Acidihalobacter aeolianus TaxID=2792603 RepID=A0A1D8K856_9GAMM|nr:DUF2934 domain-containing protein [Acidihalobacter aeolianus]AOV17147.1 hypothetical protein BJI67_08815 [Acidihalobacter aeolianus]
MSETPASPPKKSTRSTKTADTTATTAAKTASKAPAKAASTATAKAKSAAPKTAAPRTRKPKTATIQVTPEQRYRMISEAAFYIAEKHGFDPSRSLDDWLEAETLIDAELGGGTTH